MGKWVLVCFFQHYKCTTRFLLYNSSSLLEYDTWWDKWDHRPTEGTFRSWCGNVHGFHFCQSQSAGVKLLHSTISLRWQQVHGRGEETLPSTSSSRFCPHTHTQKEKKAQACVWTEHVSMTRKFTPCLPLPSETAWNRGNTKIGLCSRLRWKLSSAPNLLEMFCSVCGWVGVGGVRVGVFQLPATYRTYGRGWKRPLRVGWWAG